MRRTSIFLVVLALTCPLAVSAAGNGSTGSFSLGVAAGAAFPLAYDVFPADFYGISPGVALDAEFKVPSVPLLFLKAGVGYRYAPLQSGPTLSILEAAVGLGARFDLMPRLTLKAYVEAGYHFGKLSLPWYDLTGGALAAQAGIDAQVNISPSLGITVGAAGVMDGGVFLGIQAAAGVSYTFGAKRAATTAQPAKQVEPSTPKPAELAPKETPKETPQPTPQAGNLGLSAAFDTVFPVFHAWYDQNPLGTLKIKNEGKETATNIQVSFFMKQYMDGPYKSEPVAKLEPGKEVSVPLFALFTQSILDINTPTKSLGEITVAYQAGGKSLSVSGTESVNLQNRNAMTWIDDQRVAAFVTAMEPSVLTFARNVTSAVKDKGSTTINENLRKAMAIHEALNLYKVVYMVDPKSPYKERIGTQSIDFLQFPRETLAYKAGDCDDLSILYSALLESIAVDTAFLTIPGHIYMAFSPKLSPDEARKTFRRADELIFDGERVWIPIEVTSRDDFLTAWQLGAKEWRENVARGQARLYPLAKAWESYPPVNLPKDTAPPPVSPTASELAAEYLDVQLKFIDREIYEDKAKLTAQITATKESPKAVNALGVLYARYGLYDKAEVEFKRAASKSEYVPSLQNLGMIALAKNDLQHSLEYYERAKKQDPKNALTLLGLARVNHELENYGSVRTAYDELKKVSPDLATQFAYLDLRGEEATRAADLSKAKEVTLWAEQ